MPIKLLSLQKKLVESEFIFSEKASDLIFKLVKENLPLQNVSVGNLLNLKLDLKFPFSKLIFLLLKIYSEFSRSKPLENISSFKKSWFNFVLNFNFNKPFSSKLDFTFAIICLLIDL